MQCSRTTISLLSCIPEHLQQLQHFDACFKYVNLLDLLIFNRHRTCEFPRCVKNYLKHDMRNVMIRYMYMCTQLYLHQSYLFHECVCVLILTTSRGPPEKYSSQSSMMRSSDDKPNTLLVQKEHGRNLQECFSVYS